MPEIEFKIIDAALEDCTPEEAAKSSADFSPDLIGITGLTVHTGDVMRTAHECKKICPNANIITGGPGSTSNYDEILNEKAIDLCVIGEGEDALLELVRTIDNGGDIKALKGVAFRDPSGKVVKNCDRALMEDLDVIPFPAYHLIDVKKYFSCKKRTAQSPVSISKHIMPILSSRGCPYKCSFCHNTFGKQFRDRSAENVFAEISWLKQTYGIKELEVIDDIFNFNRKRAKEIFNKIIAADLGLMIAFPNGLKYEMLDHELMDLFKKGGVYRIAFGIESGNYNVQKYKIRKVVDLEKIREVINYGDKLGFYLSGFFQLGLPGETKQEMMDTINFATSTKLHTAMFHLTIPFPGTDLYNEFIKGKEEYRNVKFESPRRISINMSAVSNKSLLNIKRLAFLKFYFNPSRMFRIWKVMPVKSKLVYNFFNVISEILIGRWIFKT